MGIETRTPITLPHKHLLCYYFELYIHAYLYKEIYRYVPFTKNLLLSFLIIEKV